MKVLLLLGSFLLLVAFVFGESQEDDFKCVDGVGYKENDCNSCFCHDGLLGCTDMLCAAIGSHEPSIVKCEKGTTWKNGCDQCWCTGMGAICTTDCGKVHSSD